MAFNSSSKLVDGAASLTISGENSSLTTNTSFSASAAPATATVTINSGKPSANQTIVLISTDGTSKTYTAVAGSANFASNQFSIDNNFDDVAFSLEQAIEHSSGHNGKILVSRAVNVLALTQATNGADGNTSITSGLSNTDADASFVGGSNGALIAPEMAINTSTLVVNTSTSSGKVGIGETTPLGTLHVKSADSGISTIDGKADELVVEGSGNAGISILGGSIHVVGLYFPDSSDPDEAYVKYDHGSRGMAIRTAGTDALTIDSSQNVTIAGSLTVNGTVTSLQTTNTLIKDTLIELANGASTGTDSGIIIERGSTGNNAALIWDESEDAFIVGTTTATGASTGDLTVALGTFSAGSVGIGTASPSNALEIEGSSGDLIIEIDNNASNSANFQIQNGAGNARVDLVMNDGTASTTITMKGQKVGIGDTSPSYTLDVGGNAQIVTDLLVGDDLSLTSDSAVLSFGADSDTTLTHTDGTGLTLNGTNKLCFNDSSQFIQGVSNAILALGATDEIDLTATLVDMNANLDLDGTANISGLLTIQTGIVPDAQDGAYLGTSSLQWSDLFLADGAVVYFGDDNEVTLTHVADTGLLLNSTNVIQFNDASQNIGAPNATTLDINATDEIELNATLIDVNGNLDVSGTYTGGGLMTTGGNIVIPDAGSIGSASDTNAITISSGGVVAVTATTASSAANNGALTVAGGAGIAADLSVGDDLRLTSDDAVLSMGADNDVTLTHDGTTGVTIAANPITLDSGADIVLDADGADVILKDAGTEFGRFTNSSTDFIIKSATNDKDIIFKGVDNSQEITALTLDMSEAGAAAFNGTVTANAGVIIDNITIDGTEIDLSSGDLTLDVAGDIILNADGGDIQFSDGSDDILKISNSSSDVVLQPLTDAKDIKLNQYDGRTILEINDAGYVAIGNGATGSGEIRIYEDTDNGTNYSGFKVGTQSGDIDYVLPTADGSDGHFLKTNGSGVLSWAAASGGGGSTAADDIGNGDAAVNILTTSGNITLDAQANDADIIFKVDDNGQAVTALTLDGSDEGNAVFVNDLKLSSDAAVIHFGANNEVTLTHVHDVGLTITNTINGTDDRPVVLQLKSEEDAVVADDVIGSLEFAAGDSDGTDGATVAAGIHAIAEDTFSASANATKLVFTTGVSETAAASATAKMTLSSAGLLTIADDFMIKDGGTIGVASVNDAITISSGGIVTFKDDIIIKDGGTIGSASDVDAISIASDGKVTFTQDIILKDGVNIGSASDTNAIGISSGGVVSITATTASTAANDGALTVAGGVGIAADLSVGDDIRLTTDSAVISLGAGNDATLTHDGTTGLTIAANPITLDSVAALNLDAGNGIISLKDSGTEVLRFTEGNSGDITVESKVSDKDMIFKVNDGGSATEVFRLDGDVSALVVASGKELRFVDANEKIVSDGTDLTIASGAKINLNATSDIHIPNDVGIVFGGASEKIEGDGTDLTISANNLTIDCAADLILDAGGNDFKFKAGGTEILNITNSSSDVIIKPVVDAKDIIFQQRDGTEVARIEDNATFNVVTGKLAINGTAITSTAAEINLIDGGTSRGTTAVADGDGFLHNDAGTMRMTNVSKLADLFAGTGIDASSSVLSVAAAQTGITSILATDVKIGEDDETKIDFEDANKINFYANNAKEMVLVENALTPGTSDGTALGTSSLMWSDIFLASGAVANFNNGDMTLTHSSNTLTVAGGTLATAALTASTITASGIIKTDDTTNATSTTDGSLQTDGGLSVVLDAVFGDDVALLSDSSVLSFGANSEITVTHVHDAGLTITNTINGTDNRPCVLQLKSEEDAIVLDDVIASIEFAAGDSDGTDGATVAAGIHAIAEGTFSASANATSLVFTTGVSETAASSANAKMKLSSGGDLTVFGDTHTLSSSNANDPQFIIKNTANDASGGAIILDNDRGGNNGANNDVCGKIEFAGRDNGGNAQTYAIVSTTAQTATGGQEGGSFTVEVANHDGGLETGLKIVESTANGVLNVELASGTASQTHTAGRLGVGNSAPKTALDVVHDYHNVTFENQLANAGDGGGHVIKYNRGNNPTLTLGQLHYLATTGIWTATDADAVATGATQLLGIAMGTDPQSNGILLNGFVRIPQNEILNVPTNVDGLPVYVGTEAGHIDFNAPAGAGDFVRIVGHAVDKDSNDVLIWFNPSNNHVEL